MNTKRLIIITAIVLVLSLTLVGTVFAILHGKSNTVTNNLKPDADDSPSITETFDNIIKKNVKVKVNNGTEDLGYSVYVRAAIVATWQKDGEVLSTLPVAGTDYSITIDNTNWLKIGDYFYHKAPVANGSETEVLISECKQLVTKDGYTLHVEILAQTIQAEGTTDEGNIPAVQEAWKVTIDSNKKITGAAS